jgi:hypothetical protein
VLEIRLAKEKPAYYRAYLRREYKTVTTAAIAAGLIKDDINLRRFKSAWRKMTATQRKEGLESISPKLAALWERYDQAAR